MVAGSYWVTFGNVNLGDSILPFWTALICYRYGLVDGNILGKR